MATLKDTQPQLPEAVESQPIERKLIYFHCQNDLDIPLLELQDAGWETRATSDLDELMVLANVGWGRVGLLNMAACKKVQDLL